MFGSQLRVGGWLRTAKTVSKLLKALYWGAGMVEKICELEELMRVLWGIFVFLRTSFEVPCSRGNKSSRSRWSTDQHRLAENQPTDNVSPRRPCLRGGQTWGPVPSRWAGRKGQPWGPVVVPWACSFAARKDGKREKVTPSMHLLSSKSLVI